MQHPCPTNILLKYIFFLFFSNHYLPCVWFHFNPAHLFIYQILFFLGSGTHAHTHTTLKLNTKTGRWLGREHNHPTCPVGTLVRYLSHSIIPAGNRSGINIIQSDHVGYRSGN